VHPLNDIPTRIKHSSDIFGVNGSGEVGVTEVTPIMSFHADFLRTGEWKGYALGSSYLPTL